MNSVIRNRHHLFISLLLFCITAVASADTPLTVITLDHRTAEQLLPTLKPLIRQGDYLAGQNGKLFIRTDPATLKAVKNIVSELDRRPATLVITVRQGQLDQLHQEEIAADVSVQQDRLSVELGGGSANVVTKRHRENQLSAGVSVTNHETEDRNSSDQQITVSEGYEAHFYIGEQLPVVNLQQGVFGQLLPSVGYRSAVSGFSVIGRLQNDLITLKIQPQNENFSGRDRLNQQQIDTTLQVKPGEWTQIGRFTGADLHNQQVLLGRTSHRQNQQRSILIKVETLDEPD